MLVTFSAGNEGMDANGDGVVDNDSIGSPATAKNVLTVGASENDRQGNCPCDARPGLHHLREPGRPEQHLHLGHAGRRLSGQPDQGRRSPATRQQMAAFSSRGPTDDGRIKPDVVAPGTWILSGYSDLYQQGYDAPPNPQNGAYQYDGYGFPSPAYKYLSGTSMSNPLAAGGAAVVRDFFRRHTASLPARRWSRPC